MAADCAAYTGPGAAECFAPQCRDRRCDYVVDSVKVCAAASCANGVVTPERTCGAAGGCAEVAAVDCGGFACAPTAPGCRVSCDDDLDCATGHDCHDRSRCEPVDDGVQALLSDLPAPWTSAVELAAVVGGAAVVSYRYQLDDAGFAPEAPIASPIVATDLTPGAHTLSVVGKRSDGVWQPVAAATTYSWSIDTTPPEVTIDYLPGVQRTTGISVTKSGSDPESGIAASRLEYRIGDASGRGTAACGGWSAWRILSVADTLTHFGTPERCYQLRAICENAAGLTATAIGGVVRLDLLAEDRHLFVAADTDWQEVLTLVPSLIRSDPTSVRMRPLILVHTEANGFDADGLLHFLSRYAPQRVTVLGAVPAGLLGLVAARVPATTAVAAVLPTDLRDQDSTVVYAADDFATAALASVYASAVGAALVIQGGALDNTVELSGREVELVGATACPSGARCVAAYTRAGLQARYLAVTGTDRVVLANPNDVGWTPIIETFTPAAATGTFARLYDRTALAAPILAAGKRELLMFYDGVDAELEKDAYCAASNVDTVVADVRAALAVDVPALFAAAPVQFLTIVAAPNAIPDSVMLPGGHCIPEVHEEQRIATDRTLIPNARTGRIYGLSLTDVTAYVARSLFYDTLFDNIYVNPSTQVARATGYVFASPIVPPSGDAYYLGAASKITELATAAGYTAGCTEEGYLPAPPYCSSIASPPTAWFDTTKLAGQQYVVAYSHGWVFGWGEQVTVNKLPDLDLPYVSSFACSTAFFWAETEPDGTTPRARSERFGARLLRKGAMGYHGLVAPGSSVSSISLAHSSYVALGALLTGGGASLGDVDLTMVSVMINQYGESNVDFFTLLGDPTLVMRFKQYPGAWPVAAVGP